MKPAPILYAVVWLLSALLLLVALAALSRPTAPHRLSGEIAQPGPALRTRAGALRDWMRADD